MSDTWKDLARSKTRRVTFELVRNLNGTCDIVIDGRVARSEIPEGWVTDCLGEELCVKYGYCGAEFDAIKAQLDDCGRAEIIMSS